MTEFNAEDSPDSNEVCTEKSKLLNPAVSNLTVTIITSSCVNTGKMAPSMVTQGDTSSDDIAHIALQSVAPDGSRNMEVEQIQLGSNNDTEKCDDDNNKADCANTNIDVSSTSMNTGSTADVSETRIEIETDVDVDEDSVSGQGDICRICHCVAADSEILISPCECRGTMKYVHQACLQKWVKSRDAKKCELCGYSYSMTSSVKPFRKWTKLDLTTVESRRILCSVTFHVVAITCVIWSLYVLIDRTTHEIKIGKLNWPFWTKLVVVAIGFTGGLVFMYVQCKTYVKLFKKWKQFNRVIYINNVEAGEQPASADTGNQTGTRQDNSVQLCTPDKQNDTISNHL